MWLQRDKICAQSRVCRPTILRVEQELLVWGFERHEPRTVVPVARTHFVQINSQNWLLLLSAWLLSVELCFIARERAEGG